MAHVIGSTFRVIGLSEATLLCLTGLPSLLITSVEPSFSDDDPLHSPVAAVTLMNRFRAVACCCGGV